MDVTAEEYKEIIDNNYKKMEEKGIYVSVNAATLIKLNQENRELKAEIQELKREKDTSRPNLRVIVSR